jgi:nicotinate-nucleotide pyrophosphorylase (carboxylating)
MSSKNLFVEYVRAFLDEDGVDKNHFYTSRLPTEMVGCHLKFKSEMVISGMEYFTAVFEALGATNIDNSLLQYEGKYVNQENSNELIFALPFATALTGERLALNLLQRSSSIATYTKKFVEKAEKYGIKILDTRKTTPGLRSLEKYSVRVGGGFNHRFDQQDLWMVKDNHKKFFGGITEAVNFFNSIGTFYSSIEVEIHSLTELKEAINLKIRHLMLDNFTPDDVVTAVQMKPAGITYEISGGIKLENIDRYLISGVDAISVGAITNNAPIVDISLKISKAG